MNLKPGTAAKALAKNVFQRRTGRNTSQDALALQAEVGLNAIPRIEDILVDPKLSTIEKVAHALGIEAWEILR